tara:strand:- start:327107 stop:327640 length:534 start_codon:yes stop_codon:yes gene_type:complete
MKKIDDLCSKKWFLVSLFLVFTHVSFSQFNSSNGNFWDKVHYGGGIGLGFGKDYFNGSISPSAIYQVNDKFATGIQLNFSYAQIGDDTLTAYGGSIINLYNIIPAIQLSAEFEELRINRNLAFDGGNIKDNYWSPAIYLGIGYVNRNFTIGVKYNVLFDEYKSVYTDAFIPFVRVYF